LIRPLVWRSGGTHLEAEPRPARELPPELVLRGAVRRVGRRGKTEALLVGALAYVQHPRYRALILRRTYKELERSVIERSRQLLDGLATYNATEHQWRFPSGAVLEFGYLERDSQVHKYQSAEYQYVGFEELTTFPSSYPYTYLISRIRGPAEIPKRLRSTTNPGGEGAPWVMQRFAPWLYQPGWYTDEYDGPYEPSGERLHFARFEGEDVIVSEHDEIECDICGAVWQATRLPPSSPRDGTGEPVCDHPASRDRVFIRSRLEDNPYLTNDSEYLAGLQQLDPLTYAQLKRGDWLIRPAPGLFFESGWFPVEQPPLRTEFQALVRYWDRAATEPHSKNPDPDWTVGVLLGRDRYGLLWVLDVKRERLPPHGVERLILETAAADVKRWGKRVTVGLEQDPGSAGKTEMAHLTKVLQGYAVRKNLPTGDKVTRAKPWSSQARAENIRMVRGKWNRAYVNEHVGFPDGAHDDQVDASSGGFGLLLKVIGGTGGKARGKRSYANAPGGY
jgi:predicted phage terminase large subunit-like protein